MTTNNKTPLLSLSLVDRAVGLAFSAQVAQLSVRIGRRISLRAVLESLLADFAARDLDELAAAWPGLSATTSARGATEAVDRRTSAPMLAHGHDGAKVRRAPGRPRRRKAAAE